MTENLVLFRGKKMALLNYYQDCDRDRERKTAKTFHAVVSRFLARL